MNNYNYLRVTGILPAALLAALLTGGCSLLPQATDAGSAAADSASADAALTAAELDPVMAFSWGGYRADLFLPDPEHSLREADPQTLDELDLPRDIADETDSGPSDLWDRLRAGYAFPNYDHPRMESELAWYVGHPDYIARTVERARPYLYLIVDAIEQRGLPQELALLPIVESAFQPFAYSHGRAAGLWQFIPSTATHYGLKQNWWYDGRRDVMASTRAALDYLEHLGGMFDGDWTLALAAYNAGSGTVNRAIRHNASRGRPTDYWSLELPRETRAYVPKLLALSAIFAEPESYGIELASIPDEPVITRVDVGSQIDLARAAELADLTLEELYQLNPGFNRWATDPDGPHALLLPVDRAAEFSLRLAQLDERQRVTWTRHRIRQGETLGGIAGQYDTTVGVLRQVNGINGHMIRAGQNLIIPVAMRDLDSYTLSADQRRQSIQNRERGSTRIEHTVQRGDTLWDIARKYRVSVNQLAGWNGIAPGDLLRPGQELVIWRQAAASTATSSVAATDFSERLNGAHPLNNVTRRISYTVRRGDSLARISQQFNVRIADLRSWNALQPNTHLQPGQRLTLYVDVTRLTDNI